MYCTCRTHVFGNLLGHSSETEATGSVVVRVHNTTMTFFLFMIGLNLLALLFSGADFYFGPFQRENLLIKRKTKL